MRSILMIFITVLASGLYAWNWDGAAWADYSEFMSPITTKVKTKYQTILNSTNGQTRVMGRMGQIGDCLTHSRAFFSNVVNWGVQDNQTGHDYDPIRLWLGGGSDGWYAQEDMIDQQGKAAEYGNMSGWRVSLLRNYGHPHIFMNVGRSGVPGDFSWCIIMLGTNDIDDWWGTSVSADSYAWKSEYKAFVNDIIYQGCIPVLSTIPPEHIHLGDQRYELANQRIKEICAELDLAYVDLYALILHYQPDMAWDGALAGADRLVAEDGTHLSATGGSAGFSQAHLTFDNSYGARTKLALDMAEKIREIIFEDGPAESGGGFAIVTDADLAPGYENTVYAVTLTVGGFSGTPAWAVAAGSNLPTGLTLDNTTGEIAGTPDPASEGQYSFSIEVTDDIPSTTSKVFNLQIVRPTYSVTGTIEGLLFPYDDISLSYTGSSSGTVISTNKGTYSLDSLDDGESITVSIDDTGTGYTFSPASINRTISGASSGEADFTAACLDEDSGTGDGLPDPWELHYFKSTELYGPDDDPDGDGFDNAAECAAGTHPCFNPTANAGTKSGCHPANLTPWWLLTICLVYVGSIRLVRRDPEDKTGIRRNTGRT